MDSVYPAGTFDTPVDFESQVPLLPVRLYDGPPVSCHVRNKESSGDSMGLSVDVGAEVGTGAGADVGLGLPMQPQTLLSRQKQTPPSLFLQSKASVYMSWH